MEDATHWEAVEEGMELLQEGRNEEAVRELTSVIQNDPDNEYAHYFLGNAYFELEDWGRSLKCYVRALELAPNYRGALVASGHALRMMGRLPQALRVGRQALRMDENDADALYLLGVVHFQRGENDAARTYLERFLETRPEVETALEIEGMLQVIRGEVLPFPGADDTEN